MEHIVSLVIPAYNATEYMEKCLDSVMKQTYTDFDIVLVNDGSTDGTKEMAERYKALAPDRFVILDKPNGGLSSARNYGMDHISTKYVIFLDSDDYIDEKYVETLLGAAVEHDADVVCSGQFRILNDGETILSHVKYDLDEEGKTKSRFLNMHGKLYRLDYLKEHNIRFPEGKIYEDNPVNLKAFFLTDKIYFLAYEGYYQVVHLGSISTGKIRRENIPFEALEETVAYVTSHKELVTEYELFEYTLMSFFSYFILEANKKHRFFKIEDRKSDMEVVDELCDYALRILKTYCPNFKKNRLLRIFGNSSIPFKQRLGAGVFIRLLSMNQGKTFAHFYYKH